MSNEPLWYKWVEKAPSSKEEENRLSEATDTGYTTIGKVRTMKIERELDLHGMIKEDAKKAVASFLTQSKKDNLLKIKIIFGKGIHSVEGKGKLEEVVRAQIKCCKCVRETIKPKAKDGGSGALIVILKNSKLR